MLIEVVAIEGKANSNFVICFILACKTDCVSFLQEVFGREE